MLSIGKTKTLNSIPLSDLKFSNYENLEEFVYNNDTYSSIKLSEDSLVQKSTELEQEFNQDFWSAANESSDLVFKAHQYYKFKNSLINPKHGIVVLEESRYLHESNIYTGQKKIFGFARDKTEKFLNIKSKSIKSATELEHPIIYSFSTSPGFNYCHYNLDILSGIIPILNFIKEGKIKLLWGHKLSTYHLDLLKIFGLNKSHLIINKSELIRCKYLIKSSSNFHLYKKFLSSSVLNYFNEVQFRLDSEIKRNTTYPTKLLITRSKKTSKRINQWTNFDELSKLLKSQGFIEYDPGTLSIIEQINLFRSAKVIVAQHGAALTNTAYCTEGTKVIEILPDRRITKLFYTISKLSNSQHFVVIANSERIKPGNTINSFKFSVPIKNIERILNALKISQI